MAAVALSKSIMPSMQHPFRKKSHRSSMSPPRRRELSLSNENDQSFSYEELAQPSRATNAVRTRKNPRKTKMGSKHQRKYSSESISEESATSMFYVDPFGNDCESQAELQQRGRTIENQRQIRRNSLPPAISKSEMNTSATAAPPSSIVIDNATDDDGTRRRRRAPRRRSVAGNPRRCNAVDADSMTDFNMSASMRG